MQQNLDLWQNSICLEQNFTLNKNYFTLTISVRPWQIPCLRAAPGFALVCSKTQGYIKLHFATTRSVWSPFYHQKHYSFCIWCSSLFLNLFLKALANMVILWPLWGLLENSEKLANFWRKKYYAQYERKLPEVWISTPQRPGTVDSRQWKVQHPPKL